MTYQFIDFAAGMQPIAETSTTKKHEVGTRARAKDPTYGIGEFIYLPGVANTAVGNLVVYDSSAPSTTRVVAASRGPAAVAMSANVTDQYGWYQIFGSGTVTAGTVASGGNVFGSATAGVVDDAVVAGSLVQGARFKSADSGGFATVQLAYPSIDGLGA